MNNLKALSFMAISFEYPIAYGLNGYFEDLQKDGENTPSAKFKLQRLIDTQPKAKDQLIEWGKNKGILND
jgi:predicted ester cyclase